MACNNIPVNALSVKNFTGQNIKLTLIKTTLADDGEAAYGADGSLTISKLGPTYVIPPQLDPSRWTMLGDWYPTYNGYTAQTSDGLYSMSGAMRSGTSIPGAMDNFNNCNNGSIVLCASDGCYDSNGQAVNVEYTYGSVPMTTDGAYYGKYGGPVGVLIDMFTNAATSTTTIINNFKLIIFLFILAIVGCIVGIVVLFRSKQIN